MPAVEPLPPSVLIVESDPWVRDLLTDTLLSVRCDASLQVCENGVQALAALASEPDLIIAARELAGVDGLDLLRKVRRRSAARLPFILLSARVDSASVREALPLQPTAYLSKPLDLDSLRRRLEALLLAAGESVACPVPALAPDASLHGFLEQRRANADGGPLLVDVHTAVKRALQPAGLDLSVLEAELQGDPQATGVLIAAANSAALHGGAPVQQLRQALHRLGSVQSMNLMLGLTLKRSAYLSDPLLAQFANHYWYLALHTAEQGRGLAALLRLDESRCYCAGLLHSLGELAVLRCLQEWRLAGGELSSVQVGQALAQFAAPFGSALRTRWRLPLPLRELIAAVYRLGGGVYSRDMLAMHLAGQLARLSAGDGLHALAEGKTARLLRVTLQQLQGLPGAGAAPPLPEVSSPSAPPQTPDAQG